jgi:hypothetical protein
MRFKGTLILLAVCLAFWAFLYFYDIKGGERREKSKQAESQIWKLDDTAIQQIELDYPNLHIIGVRKDAKEWTLTAPQQWDADSDELNRLANSASNIRREEVVEQNAGNLSEFGLEPAQSSLKLKTKDKKEYAIDFGNSNPGGDYTYARLSNQKAVFLVASSTASAFKKKVEDLRSHSVLSFEPREVQTLNIQSPKGNFELFKDASDRWWLAGTEKRAADSPEIRGILNALSMGKIKEFFNENPGEHTNTGLDKPFMDIQLTYGKNKATERLIIGSEKSRLQKKGKPASKEPNPASPEMYLAKDESRPDLFFVDKEFFNKLLKSPDDLRDKALASFQRWDIDTILLTNTKGSFSFTKSGGKWVLGSAKKNANWEAVNGILDAMEKPVKEWIDKPAPLTTYGLDKPLIHVILKQGANAMVDCSFGKSAKNGGLYSQVQGDSSVKVADPVGIGILDKAEPDYIETPAAAPAPARKK